METWVTYDPQVLPQMIIKLNLLCWACPVPMLHGHPLLTLCGVHADQQGPLCAPTALRLIASSAAHTAAVRSADCRVPHCSWLADHEDTWSNKGFAFPGFMKR